MLHICLFYKSYFYKLYFYKLYFYNLYFHRLYFYKIYSVLAEKHFTLSRRVLQCAGYCGGGGPCCKPQKVAGEKNRSFQFLFKVSPQHFSHYYQHLQSGALSRIAFKDFQPSQLYGGLYKKTGLSGENSPPPRNPQFWNILKNARKSIR